MTKRCLQYVSLALLLMSSVDVAVAQSRPASAGPKAGNITALLPVAKITRGTGKARAILEAKKGDEVVFNDLLQTEKGGRARITLNDQSILSLGSQAELRIVKHDARTQQTALQLTYGRVRAEVASVTRDGGRFELRTPTAVAGVIGTDFGTDSSLPGVTNFICIAGIVSVSNVDEKVPGTVPCPAGSTTTVNKGLPPTPPKPATQQQIQQLIQDTEPAVISALSPASALLGTEVLTIASGSKMTGINAVSINGSGVTVALQGAVTENTANLKINVDANAAPGTRTITFTKANGQTTAAVFSILAPPKKGEGGVDLDALKKTYLEILESERQSAITGVNALGIGIQQSAADTQQAIQNENGKLQPPLDTSLIEKDITADIGVMVQGMQGAGGSINEETANAAKQLEAMFSDAQKRVAAVNPPPSDDALLKIAKDIFDRINGQLLAKFKGIQDGLGLTAKNVNGKLLQTMARWMENLKLEAAKQKAVPIPKVDADERSYDVGLMASFDAARSTPSPGGSVTTFNWVLCDPGYKPQQVGVPVPPTDTRCHPIAGYGSAASDFKFQTCNLNPQDYIARVTITDSNSKSTAMDVRLRVLPPQYEPPGQRLRTLSDSYQQLQPNAFLSFFDEGYSGLTELQESIRRTFAVLASMSINLRLSQAAIDCNEATVRADWDQNYTFKEDQTCANVPLGSVCQRIVFKQQEQLTVRMKRVPGKNWYITEFQGDNGTVQGTPPGPIQRDLSLPDLQISSLTVSSTLPAAARENGSTIGIAPGVNGFAAVVTNVGQAEMQGSVKVRFVARDGAGNEIASDLRDLPGPLAVGASATVLGQLNVPDLGPGVNARIFAVVNPGCAVTEQNCDAANLTLLEIVIGVVDLQVTGFSPVGTIIGTQPGQLSVQVKNIGSRTSLPTTGNLRLLFGTNLAGSADLPAIAPGATATVPLSFIAPALSGAQSVVLAIAPPSTGEFNPSNDALSGSLNITAPSVDLKASGLAIVGGTPPFLSGQTVNVTFNVQNTGNRPSAAADVISCRLVGTGSQVFTPVSLPPIAAGATASGLTYSFVVPVNFAGTDTLTCGASQDPFEAAAAVSDNTVSIPMVVGLNVDLQLINIPVPTGADQMGSATTVTFGVKNFGLDTAPSGWNVILKINGSQVGSFVSTLSTPGLGSQPVTINYTTPQVAPAPADVANVPASLEVNANAAVAETNTANNIATAALRLVDFKLNVIPTVTLKAVNGRSFFANAIQILPATYPLPLSISYGGLPSGVIAGAAPGINVVGVPSATAGTFTVTAQGTADGVTHAASGPFNISVANEITFLAGASPVLTAASGGGPAQNVTIAVAGGIYPLTLTVIQPVGITITGPTTITAPGNVVYSLSANLNAATGAQAFNFKAQDSGSSPNTPGNFVQGPVGYSVNSFVNMQVLSYTFITAPPLISGQTVSVQMNLRNAGNAASNAADNYACTLSGPGGTANVASGSVPSIAGQGGTLSVPISFNMPANMSPSASLSCTVNQDPAEPGGSLSDNTLATAVSVLLNVDLQIINLVAPPAALQMGSAGNTSFDVKNFGLDNAPSGWNVVLRINGSPVGTPFLASSPLAAGASVPVLIPFTVPQVAAAPADVLNVPSSLTVNGNSAISETNTANNVVTAALRLVDFTLTNTLTTPINAVNGRSFSLAAPISLLPTTYPLTLVPAYSGQPSGLMVGLGGVLVGTPAAPAGSFSVTFHATADGVTHNADAPFTVQLFDEISMSLGTAFSLTGGGSAQPFQVNVSGGIYPVTLNLILPSGVTIDSGASNPAVLTSAGTVTWNLIADTSVSGGTGLTDIVVHATDGGSTAVPGGMVAFAPPYDRTAASYDLEVTNVVGLSSNFAGRDFLAHPLLSGEGGDFSVTVRNNGPGPSPAGVQVKGRLFSEVVVTPTAAVLPALTSGNSTTVTLHVRMQDPAFGGTTSLDVRADTTDGNDSDTLNNTFPVSVAMSDWSLQVNGSGIQGEELDISVPSPASANTAVDVILSSGVPFTPIELSQGTVSSYMTAIIPSTITTTQPITISASTSPQAPNGAYAVQVIAKMRDGATVTAQRSAIIHITVNGGVPVDTVTLATSPNNSVAGNGSSCINPCVPLQIDGLLVETVAVTASRSGGSSGSTDLVFSDISSNVVSNVTTSGAPLVQQITALPYGTPVNVNFGAEEFSGGYITTGLTSTVVSATAVTTAARGGPALETVGNQQTTLHFNIGDIDVNYPCIDLGPGVTRNINFVWNALDGFSKTLSVQWVGTGGANVTVPGVTSVPAPYSDTLFTFTNNEAAEGGFLYFVMAVTISNTNGTATKFFNIPVYTVTNACTFAAKKGDTSAARVEMPDSRRSYWKRGGAGGVASAGRSVQRAVSTTRLPDLQIKPVDVSMSPSIPKPGDTLDIRFKVVNAGDGSATNVPIALQVNGQVVATETYTLKPGASTLGAFQYQLPAIDDSNRDRPARVRPAGYTRPTDGPELLGGSGSGERPARNGSRQGVMAQLVVDPSGSVKQKSTAYKAVALTKTGFGPVDGALTMAAERVYLEMNTICSGFRISSGAVVDCEGGSDLDISIEDFKSSRFTLNAAIGVADLGIVDPNAANADGAQFNPHASLVLGHTYAVQMTGGRVGYVKFSASLTPRQLEAEAKRRFGLNGVRILRKLGGDTGSTGAGDVSGRISADALMYFDMTFRP